MKTMLKTNIKFIFTRTLMIMVAIMLVAIFFSMKEIIKNNNREAKERAQEFKNCSDAAAIVLGIMKEHQNGTLADIGTCTDGKIFVHADGRITAVSFSNENGEVFSMCDAPVSEIASVRAERAEQYQSSRIEKQLR